MSAPSIEATGPAQASAPGTKSLASADPAARGKRDRKRKRLRDLRRGLLLLTLVAAATAAVFALRPKPVAVDVVPVIRGPLAVAVEEAGVTRVKDRYLISAPVTGNVARLTFEAGDRVPEHSVLARMTSLQAPLLDPRARAQADAQLGAALSGLGRVKVEGARAAAAVTQSELDARRARQLAKSGALPEAALSQAEFDLQLRQQELTSSQFAEKVAAEQVRLAKAALGGVNAPGDYHVEVLAPAAGQILRIHQKSAGVVQAGAPLLEVGDPSSLEVIVDLLTTDAVRVTPGTPVQVTGWGGEQRLNGVVRRVEPSAFTRPSALGVDEQRVDVVVTLSDPHERWAALGDGFRVEARIELWRGASVLQVPHGAVFRYGEDWCVFLLEGGIARRVNVQLGHRGDSAVEVVSGLPERALVVVHPSDRVADGIAAEAR
jgi:HlyD family secretion protein